MLESEVKKLNKNIDVLNGMVAELILVMSNGETRVTVAEVDPMGAVPPMPVPVPPLETAVQQQPPPVAPPVPVAEPQVVAPAPVAPPVIEPTVIPQMAAPAAPAAPVMTQLPESTFAQPEAVAAAIMAGAPPVQPAVPVVPAEIDAELSALVIQAGHLANDPMFGMKLLNRWGTANLVDVTQEQHAGIMAECKSIIQTATTGAPLNG